MTESLKGVHGKIQMWKHPTSCWSNLIVLLFSLPYCLLVFLVN